MFLVCLDILGIFLLNSGWKAFFLLRSKKWKHFQRGKLLKCEVLFWFKIKISCLVNTRFCWISGRDQVFPTPITFTSSTISVSLNYLPIEIFFKRKGNPPTVLEQKASMSELPLRTYLSLVAASHMCLPQLAFVLSLPKGLSSLLPPWKTISFVSRNPKTSSFWFSHWQKESPNDRS